MNHFYEKIPGFFDFQGLYSEVVKWAKNDYRFVEIGAWYGKSTAYMAVEIINSNKSIKFDVIDTWKGSDEMRNPNNECYDENLVKNGTIFPDFLNYLLPVKDIINPIQLDSISASKLYKPKTLDFVFIDADHKYESVKQDIENWLPTVKNGGIIAGHDYGYCEGVTKAVHEKFSKVNVVGSCWVVQI